VDAALAAPASRPLRGSVGLGAGPVSLFNRPRSPHAAHDARPAGTGLGNTNDQIRVSATFNSVFSPDSLQVPWYIAGGTPDWEGNLTGARPHRHPGSADALGVWQHPPGVARLVCAPL